MPTLRHALLKWLSAAVWYVGAGALIWKGAERLIESAAALGSAWPAAIGLLAVAVGALRGRSMFRRACIRNLQRIQGLDSPRPWLFFRPLFFLALAGMVGAAVGLSLLAEQGPVAALLVGGADWLIGFSLLIGSSPFWTWRPEAAREPGASAA